MTYLVLYLLGGSIATQTVSLLHPIRDDADVEYLRDLLASEHDDGRPVAVLGWSAFTTTTDEHKEDETG